MTIFEEYEDLQQYRRVHYMQAAMSDSNVVIYKNVGSINFSDSAYIALGKPNFVTLYYSREKHTCIIQQAVQSDTGALKVYPRKRTTKHYCHAKQFCMLVGVSLERLHRYEAEMKDGMLVVDLSKEQ